jgi:16S rRNA (cytidine1402-2'-O)-methyltransferase
MALQKKGILYLIPKTISENIFEDVIPSGVLDITRRLKYFIVENERTCRRYLSLIKSNHIISEIELFPLNKHTRGEEINSYLKPLESGHDTGLMSEAGTPAVADPGSVIVALAHKKNIRVVPLVGPSSIMLALMASGLNGQNFSFNGYLQINKQERIRQIRFYEKKSAADNQTQIFIETPFRNDQLLNDLLFACHDETQLCIAANISGENEFIKTQEVGAWKKNRPLMNKQPAIFLFLSGNRIEG